MFANSVKDVTILLKGDIMLERNIELKRNSFLVFTLRFLPIIFWGGLIVIWAYNSFSSDISKWLSFFSFVIALLFALNDLKNNGKCLKFSESGISFCRRKKNELVVEKFLSVDDIMIIKCEERFKNIYITLKNTTRYELLKYNSAHMLGADKFFMVKAELCRYFPSLAHEYIDDEVKSYIEELKISEFVKNKTETGRYQAVILFVIELIFAAIPLGLSIIATAWVVVKIIYHLLLGVIFILDKLKV